MTRYIRMLTEFRGQKYYIEPILKRALDIIKKKITKKDMDHVHVIDGPEGCLAGDTQIQISRGKLSRRYSIKRLYNHYNKNPDKIIQAKKIFDLSISTFIRAFDGEEIRLHMLKNVMYSGKKQLYHLKLKDGKEIKATADHKFLTRDGWKPLEKLKVNEEVMCDTLHPSKSSRKRIKLYDIQLRLDHHPDYIKDKKRVEVHRLIYEARLNKLPFLEFLDILLNEPEKAKKLKFVDCSKYHIHHEDGCHYNNSIENLKLIKKIDHLKYHGKNGYANFSQGIPDFVRVSNIIKLTIENVYDIECEEPHHNFVANGIVVHNCGKSVFAMQIGAYVDPTLTLDRVCMNPEDFKKAIINAKPRQCVIFDEAYGGLSSRASLSAINKVLVSMMMEMRQKNLLVLIVIPTIFLLDRYVALFRSQGLIHLRLNRGNRGYWLGFNYKNKKILYLVGRKGMSYNLPRVSKFKGKFFGKYVLDEAVYREKKAAALKNSVEQPVPLERYKGQRNVLADHLLKLNKLSLRQGEEYLKKLGISISFSRLGTIRRELAQNPVKSAVIACKNNNNTDIKGRFLEESTISSNNLPHFS